MQAIEPRSIEEGGGIPNILRVNARWNKTINVIPYGGD